MTSLYLTFEYLGCMDFLYIAYSECRRVMENYFQKNCPNIFIKINGPHEYIFGYFIQFHCSVYYCDMEIPNKLITKII